MQQLPRIEITVPGERADPQFDSTSRIGQKVP
jgi:hypothetical protein